MDDQKKMSRRKLLTTMGITGAAVAAGAVIPGMGGQVSANPNRDAEQNVYHLMTHLPERTVADKLRESLSVKDFGAIGDGQTDDTQAIQTAISYCVDNGESLYFPSGTYLVNKDQTINISGKLHMTGAGSKNTTFKETGTRSAAMFDITADDVTFSDLGFDGSETAFLTRPVINIREGAHHRFDHCFFTGGKAAIVANPEEGANVKNLSITHCEFSHIQHSIYLGGFDANAGYVEDVLIFSNHIHHGVMLDTAGGDGIKTTKRVRNVIIIGNTIEDQSRDAIDLFASGDTIVVQNNILKNCLVKGLDIKSDITNYPESGYGKNGEHIVITGNIISGHELCGVAVAQNIANGDANYLLDISNNIITKNARQGLMVSGKNMNISNNLISQNCFASDSTHALTIGRERPTTLTENITITHNQILNNGFEGNSSYYGLRISAYVKHVLISENVITNDANFENPLQFGGLYVNAYTENIRVSNNMIRGHERDIHLINGAGVTGSKVTVSFPSLPIDFDNTTVILLDTGDHRIIADCNLMVTKDIPAAPTDYNGIVLRKINTVTKERTLIGGFLTNNTEVKAYEKNNWNLDRRGRMLTKDDIVVLEFTNSGLGQEVKNPTVVLDVITH